MPGPLLTITIGETARYGLIAAPLIVLGHALLELLFVGATAAGLTGFLTQGVSKWLAVMGGAFMLLMGWGMFRDVLLRRVSLAQIHGKASTDEMLPGESKYYLNYGMLVLSGILISLANPYWIVWWGTIGLGHITIALKAGVIGLTSFYTGHILSDLVWYSLVGAAIVGGRRFFSDSVYRGILLFCGIFLVGLGIYFIYYGIAL